MQTALQSQLTDLAHVIQLAVAPVFLLTGVGSVLSVLTNRVGRIVDRTRLLENRLADNECTAPAEIQCELVLLSRRVRVVNWAISLCTFCALLICTVIVSLFVGTLVGLDFHTFIASLFIIAMIALILALLFFLREIYLAIASLKDRQQRGVR
ncbi:MAG: DUF2721 domain-containing protein [Methylosarcina sp.]